MKKILVLIGSLSIIAPSLDAMESKKEKTLKIYAIANNTNLAVGLKVPQSEETKLHAQFVLPRQTMEITNNLKLQTGACITFGIINNDGNITEQFDFVAEKSDMGARLKLTATKDKEGYFVETEEK
jgi:autotransporter translocation and assembly factor TamB